MLNVKVIENAADVETGLLKTFYDKFDNISYFQSISYYDIKLKAHSGCKLIICYSDTGEIQGIMFGEIDRRSIGIFGFLTVRTIVEGTPLILNNNELAADLILKEFVKQFSKSSIIILIRNYNDTAILKESFKKNGFIYEDHLNIIVDLTKSEDELWKSVNSKRRNEIRKSRKEDLKFVIKDDFISLKIGYEILTKIYNKVGIPLPSLSMFEDILNNSNENIGLKMFCVILKDEIIGIMFALCFHNTIYDWYSGAKKEYYIKYPNDFLHWEVFLWGKLNGYKIFDFGGAGKPNIPYGVRDYKIKFGGELVNYGRYIRVNKKILYKISLIGLKFYRYIKNFVN